MTTQKANLKVINCQVRGLSSNRIESIVCSGHAIQHYSDDAGLVCAAVTAVLTGGANALETIFQEQVDCQSRSGYASLKIKSSTDSQWYVAIFLIYVQLLTLYKQYPKCFIWKENF